MSEFPVIMTFIGSPYFLVANWKDIVESVYSDRRHAKEGVMRSMKWG